VNNFEKVPILDSFQYKKNSQTKNFKNNSCSIGFTICSKKRERERERKSLRFNNIYIFLEKQPELQEYNFTIK
jgi:hypothetical protein